MLRKGSETTVHAAGFGLAIGGLRPSNTSMGFSIIRELRWVRGSAFLCGGHTGPRKLFRETGQGATRPLAATSVVAQLTNRGLCLLRLKTTGR